MDKQIGNQNSSPVDDPAQPENRTTQSPVSPADQWESGRIATQSNDEDPGYVSPDTYELPSWEPGELHGDCMPRELDSTGIVAPQLRALPSGSHFGHPVQLHQAHTNSTVPDHDAHCLPTRQSAIYNASDGKVIVNVGAAKSTKAWNRVLSLYNRPSRIYWLRGLAALLVAGAIAAIVVGSLSAVRKLSDDESKHGSPLNLHVMSNSGVCAIDLNDGSSRVNFFYQNGDGGLEEWLFDGKSWQRHNPIQIPEEALPRNGTPLMAAWYILEKNQEFVWHLYYIDRNHILRDLKNSNKTNRWYSGALGSYGFKASSSNTTGLTACASPWYDQPIGIRLYYGSANDSAMQELAWSPLGDSWTRGHTFEDSNPDAGCECTRRGSSVTNLWYLDSHGSLQQRWCDFNTSANSTTHLVHEWVYSNVTYGPLKRNTAVAAIAFGNTRNVIVQHENDTLAELIVSGNAEHSTLSNVYMMTENTFVENTKIACLVLNSTVESRLNGSDLHVWAQPRNDTGCHGVDEFVRPLGSEYWADGKFHAVGCS